MNVLLPQPIHPDAVEHLEKAGCTVTTAANPSAETVLPLMGDTQGLILRTGIKVTADLLKQANKLLVIARTGGGLDNVDVAAATQKGIIVTSNLGVNTISVAEHVLSMILALLKKLPLMDSAVRRGDFGIRYRNLPRDIHGQTIGLVGFGRIGSEVGRVCRQAFGMQVLAYDPYLTAKKKNELKQQVEFVELEKLLSCSDVISIHVPLTEQTRYLIDTAEISRMKPDSILINASRGGIVNESVLIEALQNHRIAGAGLDVFSQEPVPADHPLLKLENVILTPHTAALTAECGMRMATEAVRCVLDIFAGRVPPNVANRQVLESGRWKQVC